MLVIAAAALACALVFPYLELAWACRAGYEAAEACVWGKAYFRLSQVIEFVVIGPSVFAALLAVRALARRQKRD